MESGDTGDGTNRRRELWDAWVTAGYGMHSLAFFAATRTGCGLLARLPGLARLDKTLVQ